MPRGRKGPPQESIESILLAMSQRSDVDPDTLSHYLDRLDEEWTSGAREKVLHLLRTTNSNAHSAAALILSELATDFDLEELEEFVVDPTVGDLAKLSLAPVLKDLQSDLAEDGIIDYLNDPESAMLQMQMHLLELVGDNEVGVEAILEDVLSLPVERRLGFIAWLGSSQDPRATKLLLPLMENQTPKVVQAVIEALEQLGAAASDESIPALNYLLANSSNREVKQLARAALGRLTMLVPPGADQEMQPEQPLPLHQARVSFIDAVGAQMVMLSWRRPDGLLKGVNVLCQDEWGIKDCYGTDEMPMERWQELVGDMDGQGFISFEVPSSYCHVLIAEARQQNKRGRRKMPVAYAVWRPLIEAAAPTTSKPTKKKTAVLSETMLEPLQFHEGMTLLMLRGAELFRLPEFNPWLFDPPMSLQPYIYDYIQLSPLPMPNRKRTKPSEAQKRGRDALIDRALDNLIDTRWRLLYDTRLRRQAALFQLLDRTEDVEVIRAVAAALHPDSGVPPQDQPFLRALISRSLEHSLVRMVAGLMENSSLSSSPLHFFNDGDD